MVRPNTFIEVINSYRYVAAAYAVALVFGAASLMAPFGGPILLFLLSIAVGGWCLLSRWARRFRLVPAAACLPAAVIMMAGSVNGGVQAAEGKPTWRVSGLLTLEGSNLRRASRIYQRSSGCLVSAYDDLHNWGHNLATSAYLRIYGPPEAHYDGNYPTESETFRSLASDGRTIDAEDFVDGEFVVGGRSARISNELARAVASAHDWTSIRPYAAVAPSGAGFAGREFDDGQRWSIYAPEPQPKLRVWRCGWHCVAVMPFGDVALDDPTKAEGYGDFAHLIDTRHDVVFAHFRR